MAKGRAKNFNLWQLIVKLVINVFALLVVESIIPGFELISLESAVIAAVFIGVVNTFIKPIVQIIALPISVLTLGLAAFLVNVGLLWIVALVVPGFNIDGFIPAALASILLALVSAFLHKMAREDV